MDTRSLPSDRPSTFEPGGVPFVGWSRVAHEFRVKAAEMAPGGFLRPLIIGDPGVGKKTMARAWLRVAGRGEGEWPIVDLDTWRDVLPDRCIAVTTKRPPSNRPCFLLESGAWGYAPQRPPGEPTLPADLMQRFAITLYVPPLYGHREIDILAFLDYWNKVRSQDYGIRYRKIDAALVHRMLFEDDWPANLEGISRVLRRIGHCDSHNHTIEYNIVNNTREINVLKDRTVHLGWFAPPNAERRQPGARLVEWLWGKGDIPVTAMADVAVRLYLRLCQLSPPGSVETHPRGLDPRELLLPQNLEGPGPKLTALQFLGSSPESFVREAVLPGVGINSDARERQVARFLDFVTRGSIFGTDVPALQAGLAIDPVAVARVFARSNQPEPRRSSAIPALAPEPTPAASADLPLHRFVVEGDSYFIEFHGPERVEKGFFPCSGNLGLSYYRHLIGCRGEGVGRDPESLERHAGRGALRQAPSHEDASAAEGFVVRPTHQPVLDDEAKAEYDERLKDNLIELSRAKKDRDLAEMQRLEAERDFILSELKEAFYGQHSKDLDNAVKEARDRVRKAMEDVRRRLAVRKMPQLAEYLKEATIYQGGRWSYRPPRPEREWQT